MPDLIVDTDETDPTTLCVAGAAVSCYEGPVMTDGVGECAAGTGRCSDDGSRIDGCAGQTLPAVEQCASDDPRDEDCDGVVNDFCAAWSQDFGDDGDDRIVELTVVDGGPVAVGSFTDRLDIGGSTLVNANNNGSDGLIARFDPDGGHMWHLHAEGNGGQLPRAVTYDGSHVWVTGVFWNTIKIGQEQVWTAGNGLFVTKVSDSGTPLLLKRYGDMSGSGASGESIVPLSGGVVIAGSTEGTVDYDMTQLSAAGGDDALFLRLDDMGDVVWARHAGGAGDDRVRSIAIEGEQFVYVAGELENSFDLGCPEGEMTSGGMNDGFLVKLDVSDGSCVWSRHFSSDGTDRVRGLAVHENELLVGVDVGGTLAPLPGLGEFGHAGDLDTLLLRMTLEGEITWQRAIGDDAKQELFVLRAMPDGGLLAGGSFSGTPDLGEGQVTSEDAGDDAWVLRLSPDGQTLWARTFGGDGDDDTLSAAVGPAGNVFIAGEVAISMDLGQGQLLGNAVDGFVARLTAEPMIQ